MAEREDDPWTERIRQHLDDSTRDLDAATCSRLNRARQQALLAAKAPARPRWLWPMAIASTASLAVAVMLWPRLVPTAPTPPTTAAMPEDFTMLAGSDQLDLYEDLDFYAWLDAQPPSG